MTGYYKKNSSILFASSFYCDFKTNKIVVICNRTDRADKNLNLFIYLIFIYSGTDRGRTEST